jgi:threonine 3-dehydrogenase
MKAVVKVAEGPGAALARLPVPEPGPDEVLVRVKAAAVCGTDLHIASWNAWAQRAGIRLPLVMGHEFSGEVVAAGERAGTLRAGDYVAGETHLPCGTCYQCRNGLQHICGNLRLFGIHRDGCFAEYATIPAQCAYRIPAGIPPGVAAVLEPLGTALRAVTAMEVAGDSVVVVGCGPIGLFAVASARALGASCIIGLDVRPERLGLAKALGCDITLDPRQPGAAERILAATQGVGAGAVIEASGHPGAVAGAFGYLRKGGRVALIGLPSERVSLDLGPDVVFKEATIVGIHGREMFRTWTGMVDLLVSGRLIVEPVLTHEMPLESYAEAFAVLESGQAGKVILLPSGG